MIPVLYTSNETAFTSYGIGTLTDAVSCVIVQEINGQYELMMQYPITGIHYGSIELRTIIKAKPDRITEAQLFRIYRITKPINGIVTIYARHIAYDLSGIAVSPFTAQGLLTAFAGFTTYAASDCQFSFTTDKSNAGEFTVSVPSAIWRLLGADDGCILAVYGGEYEFDNYTVNLLNRRGTNRGVSVRYGKNMTDIEQDASIADCYTAVYPFYRKENSDGTAVFVELPEKTVAALGTYGYTKVLPLDLSSEFEVQPTVEQLRQKATEYITANDIGTPKVSWKVEFVSLEQSNEYANTALFESVYLGDDVLVEFEKLGVNATARAVKIEYNVLLDRYDSVTLGSVKSNLADTIISQKKEIEKKPTKTMMENIAETLTNTLLGVNGGSVRLLDTNGDGEPDTLYIADNPDPEQAVKVWRWNYEGWAASSNGYNGPFVFGATLEEGILANAVTAANLTAGTIKSADGQTFLLNLATGQLVINGTDNADVSLKNTPLTVSSSQTFLQADYSQSDVDRALNIILGSVTPTDADYEKYDMNRDGRISNADLIILRNMVNNTVDFTYSWHLELTPDNAHQMLYLWGQGEYSNGTKLDIKEIFKATAGSAYVPELSGNVDASNAVVKVKGIDNLSDTGWISLGLASGVSVGSNGNGYKGCAYRVINGNHVYVSFNVAFSFTGAATTISDKNIPEEYRPRSGNVYAIIPGTGRCLYRAYVTTRGTVRLEWVQKLTDTANTTSYDITWTDGLIEYFI